MDKHTKKLLGSYQKTFFILLFLIPGVRKIIGKNEVFDRKGCCCDYNMYFCNNVSSG